ncbi:hypothetical protein [Rhizobium lusitanum]|uniref:Uncharacterized protein n=1 Tax=Rhizobium lusitanum TaxID=293958 RepID=A0A1C3VSB4_9HYPH|nr:hypothetical protein [Rhizobium lusitanum]SCB30676.1 hypothetical protein GA0061101_106140 [Rhizobium lusitanum]
MTVYRKCGPCAHRNGCEIKAKLAEAIKGFGVGSIMHRCKEFVPEFQPGDNVIVRTSDGDADPYWGVTFSEFPAHFVQYNDSMSRAIVYIAPGTKSDCGDYEFEPTNGKEGFCSVSYTPIRQNPVSGNAKGIIARREGKTAMEKCCGRPIGTACKECLEWRHMQ